MIAAAIAAPLPMPLAMGIWLLTRMVMSGGWVRPAASSTNQAARAKAKSALDIKVERPGLRRQIKPESRRQIMTVRRCDAIRIAFVQPVNECFAPDIGRKPREKICAAVMRSPDTSSQLFPVELNFISFKLFPVSRQTLNRRDIEQMQLIAVRVRRKKVRSGVSPDDIRIFHALDLSLGTDADGLSPQLNFR